MWWDSGTSISPRLFRWIDPLVYGSFHGSKIWFFGFCVRDDELRISFLCSLAPLNFSLSTHDFVGSFVFPILIQISIRVHCPESPTGVCIHKADWFLIVDFVPDADNSCPVIHFTAVDGEDVCIDGGCGLSDDDLVTGCKGHGDDFLFFLLAFSRGVAFTFLTVTCFCDVFCEAFCIQFKIFWWDEGLESLEGDVLLRLWVLEIVDEQWELLREYLSLGLAGDVVSGDMMCFEPRNRREPHSRFFVRLLSNQPASLVWTGCFQLWLASWKKLK